jgi:hypothetical protein
MIPTVSELTLVCDASWRLISPRLTCVAHPNATPKSWKLKYRIIDSRPAVMSSLPKSFVVSIGYHPSSFTEGPDTIIHNVALSRLPADDRQSPPQPATSDRDLRQYPSTLAGCDATPVAG